MANVRRAARVGIAFGLLLLALAGGATPARAATTASLAVRTLDTTEWPTVRLTVQYSGKTKPKLTDFTVRDKGKIVSGVKARPLTETQTPVGVVLVIDVSGSMREAGRMAAAKSAAESFIAGRGPNEKIAVVAFNDAATLVHGFTADGGASGAVAGLTPAGGTALWDAVRLASGLFSNEPNVQPNIVVLSDGADSASTGTVEDAKNTAIGAHAVVHTVAFASNSLDGAGLSDLAAATGGQALFTNNTDGIGGLFAEIRKSLDEQFELTWTAAGEDRALDLDVSVTDATTTARGAAGSVSHERDTRPVKVEGPGAFKSFMQSAGRPLAMLGAAAVAAIAVLGVAFHLSQKYGLSQRLRAYDAGSAEALAAGDESDHKLGMNLATSAMTRQVVERAAAAMEGKGILEWVEQKLDAARLPMRAAEAALFTVAFACIVTVGGFFVGGLFMALMFFVFGLGGPVGVLVLMGLQRRRKFQKQLPAMLQLLASSLRAGYALLQGVEAVAREIEEPMGAELRRVLAEARLGRPLDEALEEAAIRMGSPDFAWVVMAISIQRNVGGNLAELLDTVSETMTARTRMRREVKALTAEGRMSAIMLVFMPPALMLAMTFLSPGYLDPLFQETVGKALLGIGLTMIVVGWFWMQKIVKVDV